MLGFITLAVASAAAIIEADAKKVVALSTLRQLGVIFVSLSLGNFSMCLFHVLTHALAKSNLFLVIGIVLHSRFSQQDSRFLLSGGGYLLIISIIIRISRLIGIIFTSGFFSKEQILLGHYPFASSLLSMALLLIISSLTLSYCLKFILTISYISRVSML